MATSQKAKTAVDRVYFMKDDGTDILFKASFGDQGQSATSVVTLAGKIIKDKNGETVHTGNVKLNLGKDSGLDGKTLSVKTIMAVLSATSLHTEMNISLTGGDAPQDHLLQKDVQKKGELVAYSGEFRFKL